MTRPTWIGQTLGGRYRIDSLLGQGGMSAVYKAYDPNLKRVVAVKLIHAHLAEDPKFLTRFEEEAAAVAQLRHPNIVQVYDFNHDGDLYYMVQEFVAGETLQERLRRLNRSARRMPLAEATRAIQNICEATGYAHRRGMIHRDIKPANIMLDVHGQAILMDFGIVKILGGDRHTATGAVVGTALYLPPELIRGEAPDPRSDLYSLGVTLFEAVSGRPPFEADSAMTLMMMHLHDPLPDLRSLRPDVPEALIEVIEKSLAKDRDARYPAMSALAAALQPIYSAALASEPAPTLAENRENRSELPGPAPVARRPDQGPAPEFPLAAGAQPTGQPPSPTGGPGGASAAATDRLPAALTSNPGAAPAAAARLPEAPAYSAPGRTAAPGDPGATGAPGAVPISAPAAGAYPSGGPPPPAAESPLPTGAGSPAAAPDRRRAISPIAWIAGAGLLVLLGIAALLIALRNGGGAGERTPPAAAALPSETAPAALLAPPATFTPTPTASPTPTHTPVLPPTTTPTPTISPTPTIPPGVLFARIDGITTDNQGRYVVAYETFDDARQTDGSQHVHFFYNTTPPDQAGRPGDGNWYVYFGPSPFDKFRLVDRPDAAAQMCILVANPDHSVQFNSGNCFTLPDIVTVAPMADAACLAGPDAAFPAAASLTAGQTVVVNGMSPDEAWWNVTLAQDPAASCWLPHEAAPASGDISTLPLVEPPPLPTGAASAGLSVDLQAIRLDDQGRYAVDFTPHGFTPSIPGTHIHFYFDTVPLDDGGGPGSRARIMYGGPAPFTGYTPAQRPTGATQMCALVANPDHTIIPGSGNCQPLPDVAQP